MNTAVPAVSPTAEYTYSAHDLAAIAAHSGGKLRTETSPIETPADLALAYSPGVAAPTIAIQNDPSRVNELTWRGNLVAIVTDGTAVLGLGNVGPLAALPVMEGKAALMRRFANMNAVPICLGTTDPDEIVETVVRISPSFGAIILEDIASPRCFGIERRLDELLDIPVMHDDQHGTAVVVHAALIGALALTGRDIAKTRAVIVGAGAAGTAIAGALLDAGIGHLRVVDLGGILAPGRTDLNPQNAEIAQRSNPGDESGSVEDAFNDADVFIGVCKGASLDVALLDRMAPDSIVFTLANPVPEMPLAETRAKAVVVATGLSNEENQINNVLAFPGIFRGAIDAKATRITVAMRQAAAQALAALVHDELTPRYIVPSPFDRRVVPAVAEAVMKAAKEG